MNRNKLLAIGAEIGLIAATMLYVVSHQVWTALLSAILGAAVVVLVARFIDSTGRASRSNDEVAVGVGTVRKVETEVAETVASQRHIWIEVSDVDGDSFVGRLVQDESDPQVATLRPGLVVLVAFDPTEREELSLPDDVLAVRASSLVFA
ncbi:hypothetical protein BST27_26610 [Mycobacterium intermedium]|uniref:Uncharacterized protein n=1 Tax=Mycobacterium intermedium TaxID=28445 RepID=A0A1E3SJS0_MYCIE|nr:hypothetical protein [Mycobacterium intermedium]MCV6962608.1 hypothetical protein [Mycobacterium intermedium]ODR02375.1 hypothetical protein BHQ20_04620 [Mycobacterium intermedium]OPE48256.1 hypothetical protein BV508_18735 [Mycobacterium intermedium]ORA95660.1 hypothetical protein BST27_26610 [Mycobacterium intermedium]